MRPGASGLEPTPREPPRTWLSGPPRVLEVEGTDTFGVRVTGLGRETQGWTCRLRRGRVRTGGVSLAEAQPGRGLSKAGRAQWAEAAFFRGLAVGGRGQRHRAFPPFRSQTCFWDLPPDAGASSWQRQGSEGASLSERLLGARCGSKVHARVELSAWGPGADPYPSPPITLPSALHGAKCSTVNSLPALDSGWGLPLLSFTDVETERLRNWVQVTQPEEAEVGVNADSLLPGLWS